MKRIRDTLPAQHTLRDRFMSRMRDLLFAINDDDIEQQMKVLMQDGWDKDRVQDLYDSNYGYFVGKARRLVPKPQVMLPDFKQLIAAYTPTLDHPHRGFCPDTKLFLLGKPQTQDKLRTLAAHISNGCLSDPENVLLYVDVGKGGRPQWHCMRGTSALEGFHAHIRRFFSSHSTSPRLGQALLMAFVHRWNHRLNVKNRGGVSFGHEDLQLMHRIHHMERKVSADTNFAASGVEGLGDVEAYEDTNEQFGFGAFLEMTEEVLDEELRAFLEHAQKGTVDEADSEAPRFTDRGDDGNGEMAGAGDASMLGVHAAQLAAALASLPPSHRWLALQERLFRPTMAPQRPSVAELEVAHQIKVVFLQTWCHVGVILV